MSEPEKVTSPLAPSRIKEASYLRTVWCVDIPAGVSRDDILVPSYWRNVAGKFKAGDSIEALSEGMEWVSDLFVKSAGSHAAYVVEKTFTPLADAGSTEDAGDGLTISWRGRFHKFTVMKGADIVKTGFDNRDDATVFLSDYRRNVIKAA